MHESLGGILNSQKVNHPHNIPQQAGRRNEFEAISMSDSSVAVMDSTDNVKCRREGFNDGPSGDEQYQLFLEKHAKLRYNRQTYCPDGEDLRRWLVKDLRIFLERLGIMRSDLDSLSCIHVAGTKGKGSTCTMTEKILRTYGYKTGFISSPPLLETRERVRINGVPISRATYGRYGLECMDLLEKNKGCGETFTDSYMTGPYGIFTLIGFYSLLKEKVDMAVVEVAIGGEYDSTNVIWSPIVTGVTSLAIEHISILGDTLQKIAWHKAGIFKDGGPALTVTQKEEAMKVLVQRAKERNTTLEICPPLGDYEYHGNKLILGLVGEHQRINASLAIQLAKKWLEKTAPEKFNFKACDDINANTPKDDKLVGGNTLQASAFVLPDEFVQGLKLSTWPGRNQTIRKDGVTYYVDNAHTKESVVFCERWFDEEATKEAQSISGVIKTVLIFNLGGDRDANRILRPLVEHGFDAVVFTVMRTVSTLLNEVRDYKHTMTLDEELLRCEQHLATFKKLHGEMCKKLCDTSDVTSSQNGRRRSANHRMPILKVAPSATEALRWAVGPRLDRDDDMVDEYNTMISADAKDDVLEADHIQVLVTGSNFIVGSVINVIEPHMLDKIIY